MVSGRFGFAGLVLAILASAMASACGPAPQLGADGAYINLSPISGNPSAGYFVIHGGPENVALLSVNSPYIQRTEMHETIEENGMSKMRAIESVDVPAGKNIAFKPGGKHLMLWGINQGSVADGKLFFIVTFSNGDSFRVPAVIRKMGSNTMPGAATSNGTKPAAETGDGT